MADRGRDLKVSILSDANKFDLSDPADDLETLGREAKDAGRDLDTLGRDSKSAGDDLERLGREGKDAADDLEKMGRDSKDAGDDLDRLAKDARTTADKLDASFDAIARSSKANLRDKLDDSTDAASASLRDAGDEASSTGREMAASFGGSMDDIADAGQEAAANVLAAFGPLGAGLGLAAAVGLGFVRAQIEKTKEAVSELTGSLIESGGRLQRESVLDKLRQFAEDGKLSDLEDQARRARLPVGEFLAAMAGDPGAVERTTLAIAERRTALLDQVQANGVVTSSVSAQITAYDALLRSLGGVDAGTAAAMAEAQLYLETSGKVTAGTRLQTETLDAYRSALEGSVSPMDAFTQANEDGVVSVQEFTDTLRAQVEAQESWATNMETLAGRVSETTLAALAEMGVEGAPLVAQLVTASGDELAKLEDLFRRETAAATGAGVAELDKAAGPAAAAGARTGDRFAGGLREREGVIADAARAAVRGAQRYLDGTPLTVRTELDPSGYQSGLRTLVGNGPRVRV